MIRRYAQKKLTELGMFVTALANAWGLLSDVIEFSYTSDATLQKQESGIGQDGPAGITSEFNGASMTLSIKEQGGIDKLFAFLMRQTVATYTGWDPKLRYPAFLYANEKNPESLKRETSHFVWGAVLQGAPKAIKGQPEARQFQFEALMAREFKGAIMVDSFNGAATPVTTLSPSKTTMLAWTDNGVTKYALAILRRDAAGNVSLLDKDLGEYTETGTAITLTTGLGTGETALLAYVCAAY